jgi:hypothetical protein
MGKMAYDMSPAEQQSVLDYCRDNWGINLTEHYDQVFVRPEWKKDYQKAMDAQPQLVTLPSSGIPAYLTFFTDPDILRVLQAKNKAAELFGEKQKGDWTSSTIIFPVVEQTNEVSSYGDYSNDGRAGINTNFPERQPYLYQTICEYGELEIARAGLAKINFVSEQKDAAIKGLNKFGNLAYFQGVAGLQNYGIKNDPSLAPAIAPIPKAAGGVSWLNGTAPNATANEIFEDIQQLVNQVIAQSSGNIDVESKFVLAMSPRMQGALTATNTFNVNVMALIKQNYKNMEIGTAIQYGAITAQNPQGNAAGEMIQLVCTEVEGQETLYCSFNAKLWAGPVVRDLSSYKQKFSQGVSGMILRQPFAVATMIGT